MEDKQLIRRAQSGDRKAMAILVEKYYNEVFCFCRYHTGSEQAAYDCAQETFCRMMQFLNCYQERNKFKSYLITVARNTCMDYFRRNTFHLSYEEEYQENAGEDRELGRSEQRIMVKDALDRLPREQREVLVLRFYHDLKLKSIAEVTGEKLPTVKSRLRQGMDRMRRMLTDYEKE